MSKPKLCINKGCKNWFYVPDHLLHMCLQCEKCIKYRETINEAHECSKKKQHHAVLIGSASVMLQQAQAIKQSSTASQYSKELASKIEHMTSLMIEDLKTNRIY